MQVLDCGRTFTLTHTNTPPPRTHTLTHTYRVFGFVRFCCLDLKECTKATRAVLYFPCKINSPSASCANAARSFPDRFSLGCPLPLKNTENVKNVIPVRWSVNTGTVSRALLARLQPWRARTLHSQALIKNPPQPPSRSERAPSLPLSVRPSFPPWRQRSACY